MARLWQSGFELNSNAANVEWSTSTSVVIQTGTVRTGTYAGELTAANLSATTPIGWLCRFVDGAAANGPFYARAYLRIATAPGTANVVMNFSSNTSLSIGVASIYLNTDRTLTLQDNLSVNSGNSPALALNTWYRVELFLDNTGTSMLARLDGTQFATSTNTAAVLSCQVGGNLDNGSNSSGHWFFDDIAVNDNTGSNQTSWPGAGGITHLQPNAAGDNNAFTVQIGGTAGATNNYTRVKEVTPDDATSYNGDAVSGRIDDFAMTATPVGIGSGDTISVVAVGVRFRSVVAAAEAAFKVRIKKVTGGTVSSSAALTPVSTTWTTNTVTTANTNNYPLVTYQNPDSAAWTKALLDTAQVGYTISTTNTNAADISTVWVSIDSTPAVAGAGKVNWPIMQFGDFSAPALY